MAGVFCATKIKRRLPDSEVNLILPATLDALQRPQGAAGRRIAASLPNVEHLASRDIGILEAHSIMTDIDKQEITVSSTRGNLPVRFGELIAEVQCTARIPRALQRATNVFGWPMSGFAADPALCDAALADAAAREQPVVVVGAGMAALDACLLALESGIDVRWLCPETTHEPWIEPHLWQYILSALQPRITFTPLPKTSITALTPLLADDGATFQGIATPDGQTFHGACCLWTMPLMARHPILREDGFMLDAHGRMQADEAKKRDVHVIGSGVAAAPALLGGGIPAPVFAGGDEAAVTTSTYLAHSLCGSNAPFPGLLGVRKASMPGCTVCRAGYTLADAVDAGLEAEHALTALPFISDPALPQKQGALILTLILNKATQTLLGVQAAGIETPEAVVDGLFNAALAALAGATPLSALMVREYTGLPGALLARCASILDNKLAGVTLGITPDELLASSRAGAEFFILDLRPLHDWKARRLPGSYNIPLLQLKKRLQDEVPRFTPLVLVCANANDAHTIACKLAGLGATDLYVLEGGMDLWPYGTESSDESR